MKRLSTYFSIFLVFIALTNSNRSIAQMVGDQVFLKGKWVEVGVAPNGSLGSTRLPPSSPTYHCMSPTFTFWDPAAASATTSNQRLMMVYDAGHDGFTSGTPAFFGDYSMPGTPYEGWGIQINGSHSEAQCNYYQSSTAVTGFAGAASLTGTNTAYLNPAGKTIGVWQGTAGPTGNLQITQTTTLDTNWSWVKMRVQLKNTGATTLTGVYYLRETDPDNDVMAGGPFTTVNVINHQNDYYHRVMVTGTGTFYTSQTLSLATKDCRAKCFIHSGWPSSTGTNLATLWSSGGGGYLFSGSLTSDVAIGLLFNLGNIAAGDSTELNYTYIFNGLTGIDSAMTNPQLVVNGIPRDTTDTVTSCSFSGSSLACSIVNGSTADWFGSTWTWAPSTYLATTTGLTNTVAVSSITTPITYTITGTTGVTGCSGKTFLLTVMPPGSTPPPTTTSSLSYCLGATAVPLTASGIGTIYWWTTPTGGVGSTTPPTPSTAAVGTTTWYVSQTVAGCPSSRIPITVTVFALSTPITGSLFVCTGFTTTLANATTGGTWTSGNPAIATVGGSSGIVTGMAPGVVPISYSVLGCLAIVDVTVTTTPAAITGLSTVCIGTTTTLSNSIPGGTWHSACPAILTVNPSTGVVMGVAVGTCVVTYDMGGGCFVTKNMTVNPYPAAISGPGSLCVGATIALTSTTPSGIWSSTSVTVATVGALTGIVTGGSAGTATIRYTVGGCAATHVVTVVTAAPPITGPPTVCVGSTITLTNASAGGTWSSACPGTLTVNPSTGVVTGVAGGTCIVTYAVSAGCSDTAIVTVVPSPAPIGGNIPLCIGQTNTVTHGVAGGTWSMACPTIATVGFGTGLITAVGSGTCNVTYTLPSGCISVAVVTVNSAPAAITGTTILCQGTSATLSSATGGGTWTAGTGTVATIDVATGVWNAVGVGTSVITYTGPTSCITTTVVTVDPLPAAITGVTSVCVGQTTTLSSTTPGVLWSSSLLLVATVSGSGVVTGMGAGTATITCATPTGCYVTTIVTVNAGPAAITGPLGMCIGNCTTLTDITPGGTWSSSAPSVASVLSPGFVCGVAAGTSTISYIIGATGCYSTVVVTVNTLPGTIGGTLSACIGQCNTLTNSSGGGTWASSNTAIATIDPITGLFCGVSNGTATITYSLGTGCIATATVTVNILPGTITGTFSICQGITTTLSSSPAGGTWQSDATTVVSIISGTGAATGTGPGTAIISYTLASGCRRTTIMTVNALPPVIGGPSSVCVGQCITLTSGGGTWSSSSTGIGTIGSTTGIFCGISAGATTVSHTTSTGCYRTATIAVNGLPTSITGSLQVCQGSTSNLTGNPAGGTWTSSVPANGTISAGGGVLGGVTGGTNTTITYQLPTGCTLTAVATINSLPAAITGVLTTCVGQSTTLSSATSGGTWSSTSGNVTVVGSSGVVTGVNGGTTAIITYTLPTGCRANATVTVFALPGLITGAANLCPGTCSTLNCLPTGGTWGISTSAATIGVTTGSVCGVTPGTAIVTYTVGTGCYSTRTVTVNTPPNPITGSLTTCVGSTTNLASTTVGGVWNTSSGTIASVSSTGPGTAMVTGNNAGTATISYTDPGTTCRVTAEVTVYALPGAIGGSLNACNGQCTTFTNSATGGTWASSTPAVGTINTSTGMFCGLSNGTSVITYTLGTGCNVTAIATVNPLPAAITGTLQVCQGATTTLSNATGTGSWSSAPTSIAVISSGGVVTGVLPGTALISYTLGTGCASTAIVTVNSLPAVIAGPSALCVNQTITLTSTPTGGVWSSPHATVAVNPVTGDVTGMSAGTATILYTNGCVRTTTVTVNGLPNAITGNPDMCIGSSTTLATTSTGGTWTSSTTGVATVNSAGVVSSVAIGTTTISYTFTATGCATSVVAQVHGYPTPIMGSDGFCNLTSTTYTSSPAGGTWSSANTSILTIDPLTGYATGVLPDTTDVIYTSAAGCSVTKRVFLILAPYPIDGPDDVCLGQTATLTNPIGGGVWTSDNSFTIPVDPSTGVVTGANLGTANISYTLSTGCSSAHAMTVNPIPVGIIGVPQVCVNSTITLSNATPGGTWRNGGSIYADIDSVSGIVTGTAAGTVNITYALGTGCNAQFVLTVNPLPDTITGIFQVCEGSITTLVSGPTGGVWDSEDPSVAAIDAGTGVVTGISAATTGIGGAGVTMITYTLATGCKRTEWVTVNPLPNTITGLTDICVGDVTTFNCSTPGGGWMSSLPAIGTIDGVTGIAGGISAGTTTISYILGTGCQSTHPLRVHANPAPITGSLGVCAGFATNLASGPAGGVWSQGPGSYTYGTIHSLTGVVSGIVAGIIPVTYTLGSGCRAVNEVTVITLPAVIGGVPQVCVGETTTMTNPVGGGVWTSSNIAKATIDPVTGTVLGIAPGTAVITYSVGTGCFNVHTITVNPLPATITGPLQVCEGSSIVLSSASPGGLWISDATSVATAGITSGVISGISAGVANISYSFMTGCRQVVQVTVNETPAPIMGNPHICMGSSNTFTSTSAGGIWYSSNPAIATIHPSSGVATSVSIGSVTISYVYPSTGCMATMVVSVQPLPVVYNVMGGGDYCAGGTGKHVNLSGSQPGVSYELYYGSSATGFVAGSGFPIDFGLHTLAGVYTVQATNMTSGCKRNMAGSATIIVNPLVTPSVTINTSPYDSVCPGQSVTLTPIPVNEGTAPTYLWKVNGTTVSTASVYAFAPANGDNVTVTMTSNASCLATPTVTGVKTLTVLPNEIPIAGMLATPGDTVCQYSPVTLTAAPMFGGPSPSYTWLVNGVVKGSGPVYSYVPVDGDVVNLRMTSDYRCRLANTVTSEDLALSVDPMLTPTVSIWPEPGFAVESGKPATIHATAINAGVNPTFQWMVNGKAIAGATSDMYTAIFNDYDSISCTVISSGVCKNIGTHDWVFITMTPLITQQPIKGASDFRLVPNPNKGVFTVKGSLGAGIDEEVSAEVTDMLGQVVYRGVLKAKQGRIDAQVQLENNLANGMYILTLRTEAEQKVFHFVMEQ